MHPWPHPPWMWLHPCLPLPVEGQQPASCGWVSTCRTLSFFCPRHVLRILHPCHHPRLDPTRVARCIDRMPLKAMPTSPPVGRVIKVPSHHVVRIRMDVLHPLQLQMQLRVVRALLPPSIPTLLWVLMPPPIIWGAQSIHTTLHPIIFITIWGVCILLLPVHTSTPTLVRIWGVHLLPTTSTTIIILVRVWGVQHTLHTIIIITITVVVAIHYHRGTCIHPPITIWGVMHLPPLMVCLPQAAVCILLQ